MSNVYFLRAGGSVRPSAISARNLIAAAFGVKSWQVVRYGLARDSPVRNRCPHACQADVPSGRSDVWLRCHELKGVGEFLVQCARGFRPIVLPPPPGLVDVPCRTASKGYREARTHFGFRSPRKTSSADTVVAVGFGQGLQKLRLHRCVGLEGFVAFASQDADAGPVWQRVPLDNYFPATTRPNVMTIVTILAAMQHAVVVSVLTFR